MNLSFNANRTSPGLGKPGPASGARPGGGTRRASGDRSSLPRSSVGPSPKKQRGNNDGLATCLGGSRVAQRQNGEGGLKRKRQRQRHMDIGIWNIRSIRGREPELVEEAAKYRLDIVGVSETREKGKGSRDTHMGWKLFYSGVDSADRAHAGVGILTSPRMNDQVIEWLPKSERLGILRIKVGERIIALIQVYAPNCENEYVKFVEEVALALESLPNTDSIMLLGDFNAHVGNDDGAWNGVIGRNGDASINSNGRQLLDLCANSGLSIMNTYFRHKNIHKYTWGNAAGTQKSLIDLVIVSADIRELVSDVRVKRGAELSTDHHLVVCRLRCNHRPTIPKVSKTIRIKWESLRDSNVAKEYADNIEQMFSQIPPVESEAELEWQLFKTSLTAAAAKACGFKRVIVGVGKKPTPWYTKEVREIVNEKKKRFRDWLKTKSSETRLAYNNAKKAVKDAVSTAKMKSWENFGMELENNYRGAQKLFWQTVRRIRKGKGCAIRSIKDQNGTILTKEVDIIDRWKEYFKGLLNPVDHVNQEFELHYSAENSPTVAEVEEAVKHLKPGKAAGVDEIRPEMLKAMNQKGLEWLTRVFEVVWKTGKTPIDWQTGVVVPLHKKGDQKDCNNYRGITLLSLPGKAYASVLHRRLSTVVNDKIQDEQCGFRPGRGTTDQLFILQQISEKAWEYDKEVHVCFVDLEKAYDRVDRNLMWETLKEYGVDDQLVGAIASLYKASNSCVRVLGRKSDKFNVGVGLRQGCVLSPLLFIVYMDRIARRSLGQESVMIGDVKISHLLFADDLAILASSSSDLQHALSRFASECEASSMKVNVTKTETIVISRKPTQCTLHVSGVSLAQVEKFKYLGVEFTSDGRWEREIDRRIGSAAAVARQLSRGVLNGRCVSQQAKLAVYNTIFTPTLTYGHENWVLTERIRSRIQAAEMRVLRRIYGVTRLDRVRNTVIRGNLKVEALLLRIERSQLRWLGHVLRMPSDRITKNVWNSNMTGIRPRGRPRIRWKDQASKICDRLALRGWPDICAAAEDRRKWKELLRGLQ